MQSPMLSDHDIEIIENSFAIIEKSKESGKDSVKLSYIKDKLFTL